MNSYVLVKANRKNIQLSSVLADSMESAMSKFEIKSEHLELSLAVDELEYRIIELNIDLWIDGTCASDKPFTF